MLKSTYFLITFILVLLTFGCSSEDNLPEIVNTDPDCNQIVYIPDVNFKQKLLTGGFGIGVTLNGSTIIDSNSDGEIQVCEAEKVIALTIEQSDINSIEGILKFRNIQTINFKYNNIDEALDLSSLKRLVTIMLTGNSIPSLKVNNLNRLEYLACDDNNLEILDVSSLQNLKTLLCQYNQISNLNTQGVEKIVDLRIYHNNITQLNLNSFSELKQLYANDNLLTSLDISGLRNLFNVNCSNNNLQSLNATGCIKLNDIYCEQNNLTLIKLMGCTNLVFLKASLNNLSSIDLTNLNNLVGVDFNGNQFVSLDFRNTLNMSYVNVSFNPYLQSLIVKNGSIATQGINIYSCPMLNTICCDAEEVSGILIDVQNYGYNCNVITNCF